MRVQAFGILAAFALLPTFAEATAGRPQQGPLEQTTQGTREPAALVESFDGMGVGFEGPQR